MIKLYTSYFANLKNTDSGDYLHINISRFPPVFFKDYIESRENFKNGPAFAPSADLLKRYKAGECTMDEYKCEYITQVYNFIVEDKKMSVEDWVNAVNAEFGEKYKGIIFYCFEKPDDFCHRHLLARFFEIHGIPCTEIRGKIKAPGALF